MRELNDFLNFLKSWYLFVAGAWCVPPRRAGKAVEGNVES